MRTVRVRFLLWAGLMMLLAAGVVGCGSDNPGALNTGSPGQAVTLARDYTSGTVTHKAGEVILLSRINSGFVDQGPSCTDAAGNQKLHLHSNNVGQGIYIDGIGPFLETQAEHDACGYGLIAVVPR